MRRLWWRSVATIASDHMLADMRRRTATPTRKG